jgi:hypothetical protein
MAAASKQHQLINLKIPLLLIHVLFVRILAALRALRGQQVCDSYLADTQCLPFSS